MPSKRARRGTAVRATKRIATGKGGEDGTAEVDSDSNDGSSSSDSDSDTSLDDSGDDSAAPHGKVRRKCAAGYVL